MSKAFVIKNKQGKYLISIDSNHKEHFGKDLFSAEKFHCKGNAKAFCPKDCEVVEITIAEGNLEQQLAIIKKALLKASKEAFGNKISIVSSNYPKKITNSEEYAEYLIFEIESEVKNGN